MAAKNETVFVKDLANKTMRITRTFNAPLAVVRRAWTDPEILDQWWAPKPWKAVTKSMDFRVGGSWLYCMQGPQGEKSWGIAEYDAITNLKNFSGIDSFCDEDGKKNPDIASTKWTTNFISNENTTEVVVEMVFNSEADIQQLIDMGFQQGFEMAHGNLDEVLLK